jgi:hypothetical protein
MNGTKITLEQSTYSDDQCTQRSSGGDVKANGTFSIEEGGIVDGKQLTKINWVITYTYTEGFLALFIPAGSTQNTSSEVYIDGNTMYDTDGQTNLFGDGSYVNATQIYDNEYWTKQ